jgi:hypothetical protein
MELHKPHQLALGQSTSARLDLQVRHPCAMPMDVKFGMVITTVIRLIINSTDHNTSASHSAAVPMLCLILSHQSCWGLTPHTAQWALPHHLVHKLYLSRAKNPKQHTYTTLDSTCHLTTHNSQPLQVLLLLLLLAVVLATTPRPPSTAGPLLTPTAAAVSIVLRLQGTADVTCIMNQ